MNLSEKLEAYFAMEAEVHKAFGYVEDWRAIPMDDCRGEYWMLVGGEGVGGVCVHSPELLTKKSLQEGTKIYASSIYTQRFLKKWVYRTDTHVMVAVDTRTDGNKFLAIFDADKECTDQALRSQYKAQEEAFEREMEALG